MDIKTDIFNYEQIEKIKVVLTISEEEYYKLKLEYSNSIRGSGKYYEEGTTPLAQLIHSIGQSIYDKKKEKKIELINQLEKEGLVTKDKKNNFWSFLNNK